MRGHPFRRGALHKERTLMHKLTQLASYPSLRLLWIALTLGLLAVGAGAADSYAIP